MRGWVFDNLPALRAVNLADNECINKEFKGEEEIRRMSKTLNETCGIDKTETQIACEKINELNYAFVTRLTCEMNTYTAIKDVGYTISDQFNDEVAQMFLNDNQNIEFLPILLNEKFPNLENYFAERCAIKEIFKINFENLHRLAIINLNGNQIYAILRDTFAGLANLRVLDLRKLRLRSMVRP